MRQQTNAAQHPRGPFASPTEGWSGVSPRLTSVRRISVLGPLAIAGLVGVVAALVSGQIWLVIPAVALVVIVLAWLWWVIGRQVGAMGYALRNDDLVVVSGIMFRRLVVVPYGRMQLVDVTSGPIDRKFGLAAVQLHTAAATTDATVPGLEPVDATNLRDRLAALGEQRSAGL